jgi:hypothetical protein
MGKYKAANIRLIYLLGIVSVYFTMCSRSSQSSDNEARNVSPTYKVNIEGAIFNNQHLLLSSIGHTIEYIPLQTLKDVFLKRIDKIAITDSFFFISDSRILLRFTRDGKFLNQIGANGRGPGEYPYIYDISADYQNQHIYILTAGIQKVLAYDFYGNFLRSFKAPGNTMQFILNNDEKLIFHIANVVRPAAGPVYSWYITDIQGNELIKIENSVKRTKMPGFAVHRSPLYNFDDNIHFMEYGIDTLYFFNSSDKKPYAIFELGKLKMDPDPFIGDREKMKQYDQTLWINDLIEDHNNIYINLYKGLSGKILNCVFSKEKSDIKVLENNYFINDLDGGPDFWPDIVYNDSILISSIDANKLLRILKQKNWDNIKQDNVLVNSVMKLESLLSETSNPVIMVVK